MSHEITGSDRMFSVGEKPWHGLGRVLDAAPSPAEGLMLAGLNWQVDLRPLTSTVIDGGQPLPIESHRAVFRMDTGEALGVVGTDFHPLQNSDAFAFFEPLVAEGLLTLETAGSLRNGRRVWVMAKVTTPSEVILRDDVVEKYVLLCHGHDGSLALRVGSNAVRVVCANTLSEALNDDQGLRVLRHTAGLADGLETLREVLSLQIKAFHGAADAWRYLASVPCDDAAFTAYALRVFAARGADDEDGPKGAPRGQTGKRLLEAVRPLFEAGVGTEIDGVRGTYWAAYNAITEWLSHHRGKGESEVYARAERRFEGLHLGEGRKLGIRALMLALEAAKMA